VALVALPAIAPLFVSKSLVDSVSASMAPKTRTGSFGYDEQSLIWYFRFFTSRFHERVNDPEAFLDRPGPAICVVEARRATPLEFPSARVTGYNFARWRLQHGKVFGIPFIWPQPIPVELVAYIKR
jgi:hypothetical protein